MKTPEEIKKALEYCRGTYCDSECPYYNECKIGSDVVITDYKEYVRQLEAQVPRWISVEERLPEQGRFVAFIPTCNQGSVYVGILSHVGKMGGVVFTHKEGRCKSNYYAKHWMPLPEAPEEDAHAPQD